MSEKSSKPEDHMSREAVAERHARTAAAGEAEVRRDRDERSRAFERAQAAAESGAAPGSVPFAKPRIFE